VQQCELAADNPSEEWGKLQKKVNSLMILNTFAVMEGTKETGEGRLRWSSG